MHKYYVFVGLASTLLLAALVGLAACGQGPSTPEPLGTAVAASAASPTGAIIRSPGPGTPAVGAVGALSGTVTATTTLTGTVIAIPTVITSTPTRTITPGPTRTPSNTPTPAPSRQTLEAAGALEIKLAAFIQALGTNNLDAKLQAQREVLEAVTKMEATMQNDRSKEAEQIRAAVSAIREGIEGDRSKLEGADARLRAVLGLGGASSAQAGGPLAQVRSSLAAKVAALQAALQGGQSADALRLQREVLDEVAKAEEAIKNTHNNDTDQVRSAIEDIRGGLGGDRARLNSALDKLGWRPPATPSVTATAGPHATPSTTATARPGTTPNAPTPVADVAGFARSLDDALSHWAIAKQDDREDEMSRLQKELEQSMNRAQEAIAADRSPKADQLRAAIQALREAFSGDQNKLETARARLKEAMG